MAADSTSMIEDVAKMTILEHLTELRERLIKAVVALLLGTVISLAFTTEFLKILIAPMGGRTPISLRPTETIMMYFKIALIMGCVLAMPIIIYQLIRFILPGLTDAEKKYLIVIVPGATGLFAMGVAFAAFVMLPFTVQYLQTFLADIIQPMYSIDYYISFVTTLMFWVGVVFETPLIIAFLSRVGILSPTTLTKNRKYAFVALAVLAAIITPTPDPVNMMLVMVPLLLLYEVGVILAKILYKPRAASPSA
jgi:sec-independent protein translocase protein TatC